MERVVLIIPTYDEAENIVELIRAFKAVVVNLEVVVADSDSLDGTAKVVRENFEESEGVWVLECERKQGRGAAIKEAYKWIRENSNVDLVAVADADFSHDPKDFNGMLEVVREVDVVIGSRYLSESRIVNWTWKRQLFSLVANWAARLLLRVGIKDYTNGYRLFRREALGVLDFSKLDADGFIMLSQELMQWHRQGLRIREVPILFVNRVRGMSRFRLSLVWESLQVLIKLSVIR